MADYVNGGVEGHQTKKSLKEAVKADPHEVYFYGTSTLGRQFHGLVDAVPEGVRLSVCGPNPYNDRKWYATIENKNGKIVCT